MRTTNLLLVFLLELAALVGYGMWAWSVTPGGWRFATAVLLPLAVATLWGLALSPRARVRLPRVATVAARTAVLMGGALALAAAGYGIPAFAMSLLVLVTTALAAALGQDEHLGEPRPA